MLYLNVDAGNYHLLLNSQSIIEVIDSDTLQDESSRSDNIMYWIWRDEKLPVVNIYNLLQEREENQQTSKDIMGVVRQREETRIIMAVNHINGLLQLEENDFSLLPPLPEKAARLFDKTFQDTKEQIQLLRLRYPLPLDDLL